MFVPYKEEKLSGVEKNKELKGKTKGRYADNIPRLEQYQSVIARKVLEKANPEYAALQRKRAEFEDEVLRKKHFTKTLFAVREEYKAGILVSRVPPEIAAAIESMKK